MVAACSSSPEPPKVAAARYLDSAISLIRANDIYADRVDWPAVTRQAHALARYALNDAGTYQAIGSVLGALGDRHAGFVRPGESYFGAPVVNPAAVYPLSRHLAAIVLGGFPGNASVGQSVAFEDAALRAERVLSSAGICGWVVDLRSNPGGNPVPMLVAVEALLGEGRIFGIQDKGGKTTWYSYTGGAFHVGGSGSEFAPRGAKTIRSPLSPPVVAPNTPVAVLTGPGTFSAAEGLTLAFRGRPGARSFGAPTGGGPTPAQLFRLADGAQVRLAVARTVDRLGHVYDGPIPPDVPVPGIAQSGPDPVLAAAEAWLLSDPACVSS